MIKKNNAAQSQRKDLNAHMTSSMISQNDDKISEPSKPQNQKAPVEELKKSGTNLSRKDNENKDEHDKVIEQFYKQEEQPKKDDLYLVGYESDQFDLDSSSPNVQPPSKKPQLSDRSNNYRDKRQSGEGEYWPDAVQSPKNLKPF